MEKGYSDHQEKSLMGRCIRFVINLVQKLRQRLPNNVKVLEKTSFLSVNNLLHCIKDLCGDLGKLAPHQLKGYYVNSI